MTDLLGPADAGAPRTLSTTADVSSPTAGDTWFADCVPNTPGTGTPYVAKWTNRLLQQIRRVIRLSGIPLSNADDDMLGQAIQSGATNWAILDGTANAVTATLSPVPLTLVAGLVTRGTVVALNTAATTLNHSGLGPISVYRSDAVPLAGGELVAGGDIETVYDGAHQQLQSQLPMSFVRSPSRVVYPQTTTTYTVAPNETRLHAQGWAAGGNGSGSTTGGGGGAGGFFDVYLTGLTPGESIVCTIGTTAGATTSFTAGGSTVATANGGATASTSAGAAGGSASISLGTGLAVPGQTGGPGTAAFSGYGGAASFGSGFAPQTQSGAGNNGLLPGGGGSGGLAASGGVFAPGMMIIEFFT